MGGDSRPGHARCRHRVRQVKSVQQDTRSQQVSYEVDVYVGVSYQEVLILVTKASPVALRCSHSQHKHLTL